MFKEARWQSKITVGPDGNRQSGDPSGQAERLGHDWVETVPVDVTTYIDSGVDYKREPAIRPENLLGLSPESVERSGHAPASVNRDVPGWVCDDRISYSILQRW
jgi:hypothetical protein